MKRLDFGRYSSTEWAEFKRIYGDMFWADLQARLVAEAREIIQGRVYEEFEVQVGAKRYERSGKRRDERNGTRRRTYEVMAGRMVDLVIPRARRLEIRFTVFEKWERVQPQVLEALLKAYLLGRSAACAAEIAEAFGHSRFSRSYLQRLVRGFEERLRAYHARTIENWPYVFIDGMGVKVQDVSLKDKVVIFAIGLDDEHRWEVLDWVVADREDEGSVRGLLGDLKRRGLASPKLFTSDESSGIRSALRIEYPRAEWQLCTFHKISNIQMHLRDLAHRKGMLREAGDIYELSRTRSEALSRFEAFRARWRRREPEAVRLFSRGFEDTLRYFDFPQHMWVSIRTNNLIEQYIGKLRDWTARFHYFRGYTNLDLALFTHVCHKKRELVLDPARLSAKTPINRPDQNPTLIVA